MRVSARFLDVLNYLSATDSYDGARSYQVYDGRHRGEYDYGNQEEGRRKPAVPFQVIKRRAVQTVPRALAAPDRRDRRQFRRTTPAAWVSYPPAYVGAGQFSRGEVRWCQGRECGTTGRDAPLFSCHVCERRRLGAGDGFDVEVFARSFRDETRSDSTPGFFAGTGCQLVPNVSDTFVNIPIRRTIFATASFCNASPHGYGKSVYNLGKTYPHAQ